MAYGATVKLLGDVLPIEAAFRKRAVAVERAEEGTILISEDPGFRDIRREIQFQVVVAGNFELFSACLRASATKPVHPRVGGEHVFRGARPSDRKTVERGLEHEALERCRINFRSEVGRAYARPGISRHPRGYPVDSADLPVPQYQCRVTGTACFPGREHRSIPGRLTNRQFCWQENWRWTGSFLNPARKGNRRAFSHSSRWQAYR